MSEFTDELKKLDLAINLPSKTYFEIEEKFKDWQPPKPHQSLPVVPEDVDKAIKYLKGYNTTSFSDFNDILTTKGLNWLNDFQFKDRRFGFGGLNNKLFILSHLAITGYTVDKEQLYYLCEKNTGYYLNKKGDSLNLVANPYFDDDNKFTQSEINKLNIGSYEQIPVKVDEVEG